MTYLSTLSVEHFRGILAKQEISFSHPTGNAGSGLTILVGPNNVGKSTVVEALRCAVSPPFIIDRRERHTDRALRISIRDSANGYREITNPNLGANIAHSGSAHPTPAKLRFIPSRRSWSHRTNSHSMDRNDYWAQRNANTKNEDPYVISRLNAFPPEEKIAFQAALQQIAPQLLDWKIEYSDGHTYLEYVTINGGTHTADLFGEGISSLFRIVLALYDPEESLVIIDEPELSLHPQAQKRLAKFISNKSKERQVILCTHSPYFVSWKDLAEGANVYRLRQDRNGIQANRLSDSTIASLSKLSNDWQKPQLLDAVAKEVFFADEVLFLEGQEDVSLIQRFVDSEDIPGVQIFGYGAGGAPNISSFMSIASDLKIPCGALFDGTSKDDYQKARARFPQSYIELLPVDDIRDKTDTSGAVRANGIFDRSGTIKPEHREYMLGLLRELRGYFDETSRL